MKIPVSITTTDDHLLPAITALFHHRTTWSDDGAEVHAEAARIAEQVDCALDVWRGHTMDAIRAHLATLTAQHPAELVIPAPASHSDADIAIRQDPRAACPRCRGTGGILMDEGMPGDPMPGPCPDCGGTGYAADTRAALER